MFYHWTIWTVKLIVGFEPTTICWLWSIFNLRNFNDFNNNIEKINLIEEKAEQRDFSALPLSYMDKLQSTVGLEPTTTLLK